MFNLQNGKTVRDSCNALKEICTASRFYVCLFRLSGGFAQTLLEIPQKHFHMTWDPHDQSCMPDFHSALQISEETLHGGACHLILVLKDLWYQYQNPSTKTKHLRYFSFSTSIKHFILCGSMPALVLLWSRLSSRERLILLLGRSSQLFLHDGACLVILPFDAFLPPESSFREQDTCVSFRSKRGQIWPRNPKASSHKTTSQ